jgi:hypothetical protein
MDRVHESIRNRNWTLRHTETTEKSVTDIMKPFQQDFQLKSFNRGPLFEELLRGRKLRHVETTDKSGLHFDQGFKLRQHGRGSFLTDIKKGSFNLKPTKTNDRSAPSFQRFGKVHIPQELLQDVKSNKAHLHHVETIDKSHPMIEKGTKINKGNRRLTFISELNQGIILNHVETCDKAKPQIPRNFHLSKIDRGFKQQKDLHKGIGIKHHQSAISTY